MTDDLRDRAAALNYLSRIRRQGVLHLGCFIRLCIGHQGIEWVLLIESLGLVRVSEALLSVRLLEVLA